MKYIVVTGGVCSGVGKGLITSSIGALLKSCNLKVTAIKIDPYYNSDAGTFSPYEHGEVFVLNDGCEADLDLGNYERFLDTNLKAVNNITTGKINKLVYDQERQGDYLGKTVQIVPHITNAILQWIEKASHDADETPDVCVIELGGTIGDIEGMPFIEALRQLKRRVKKDFCCCHVTLVPTVGPSKELKSKPTQQSVAILKKYGFNPDMIVCRSDRPTTQSIKEKISLFCDVEIDCVLDLPDLKTIYQVPLELKRQGILDKISQSLNINACAGDSLIKWQHISDLAVNSKQEIKIALVGKYTALSDCYISVVKALEHACFEMGAKPKVLYIDSTKFLDDDHNQAWTDLKSCDCLLVPGGFGIRGTEGKIAVIKWARENRFPFLGICLGFQLAVVEYARHVCKLTNANSFEFDAELRELNQVYTPIIIEMLEYLDPNRKLGGTMRLGSRKTKFVVKDSILKKRYNNVDVIEERHRHRFEINPIYIETLEEAGLKFVGKNDDGTRMEILELDPQVHPYFVAVQYHPEYNSRAFRPSPPYVGLIDAAQKRAQLLKDK